MDTRFHLAPVQQNYYPNNYLGTQPPQYGRSLLQGFNSTAQYLDSGANQVLQQFRNIGRDYQSFMSNLGDPRSQMANGYSDTMSVVEGSADTIGRVRPAQRLSGFSTGAIRTAAGVGNAIVGVGDALTAFANDYDRGNASYSGFMREVPRITGQLVVLGGAGLATGAMLGVSLPVVTSIAIGTAAAWGFGRLYNAIF